MDKDTLKKLEKLLAKLMPLVGSATKKLRFLILMGIAVILWLFIFMFVLQKMTLGWALGISVVLALPVLWLSRFYFALQDLNDLPEMINEIKTDLTSSLQALTSTKKVTAVNAVSGAKDLWEIRSLLSNGREMLGDYVSIAVLANPLSLFLGVLSVISLFALVLLGIVLGIFAIF
ncbi:MAG TPA: hypothetical protein ENJ33_08860 [Thiothrix sp.]|nr:hypothetical protein [Thiothrix sp.]